MEEWTPIIGYDGRYEISNWGNLWSNYGTGRILKQRVDSHGYRALNLYNDDGPSRLLVHRIVLEAFIGPCPDGMVACHNNGNKMDNSASNLRWDTTTNNHHDKIAHGTAGRGSKNAMAKLTEIDVDFIRHWLDVGHRGIDIAKVFGVSNKTISQINVGTTWKHHQTCTA